MTKETHRNSHEFMRNKVDLALLVSSLRTINNLTVRDLSVMADVIPSIITNIETCKNTPNFCTISKIFTAFGVTVGEAYAMIDKAD